MSADPQRKPYRYTCNMIRPQIYSEKSLMESVVDFFSDVVPQAYSGAPKVEDKEKIQWVKFENCDCNDIAKNPDMNKSDNKGLPLLLILGYSNGVQIWHITPNGEAQEILSIRQGPVRILRILPNPDSVFGYPDTYSSKRPLAIMCDSSSAGQPYCGIKFVSLKTGDEVHSISFKTLPIHSIECNKRFVVIMFLEKVCVYEACQFKQLFWITSCYPCSGPNANPIALSTRWLAYADKRLVAMHQSCGGMSGDGSQSYAATVISAAKGAFKGLSMFGEAMVSSVTGSKSPCGGKKDYVHLDNGNRPGIVSVVDIQNVHNDHFNVNEDNEGDGLIAHFHAHANEPVSSMAFDPTGTLLVTACKLGHNFHVFRLMAHPCGSSLGAVHHLYTLHRGDTTAKVIDISFNHDSRWVTVSTHRGTTHLFPITTYGGPVTVRTHCQPHVVNRASRFHKSAGLEEIEHSPMGRSSPILSTSPGSSGQYDRYPTLIQQNTLNNNMGNPRLPPYPHPTTVYPAYQVKQPLNVVLNPANKNQSPSHSPTGFDNVYSVCAKFCTPRMCVIGSPKLDGERREGGKRPVEALFVMAQSGILVEYVLEPKAKAINEKVTDDTNLDLSVVGRMQWNLQRLKNSSELRPPLASNSPLILANEAVISQIPTAADLYDLPGLTRQDSKDSLSSEHSSKDDPDEQWLSQVEIITHVGPHRRLWMGPQFSFKTYQENTTVLSSNSSALLSQSPDSNMHAMDITGDEGDLESLKVQPARSNPVTMPTARPAYRRLSGSDSSPSPGMGGPTAPLMIEAGSFDQSPHLLDVYSNWTESTVEKRPRGSDDMEDDRIKETLADAMVESPIKDIEKLSLRQECSRTSVTSGKAKNRSENLESKKDSRKKIDTKEIGVEETVGGKGKRKSVGIEKGKKGQDKNVSKVVKAFNPENVKGSPESVKMSQKIETVKDCGKEKESVKSSNVVITESENGNKDSVDVKTKNSGMKLTKTSSQTDQQGDKEQKGEKSVSANNRLNEPVQKQADSRQTDKETNQEELKQKQNPKIESQCSSKSGASTKGKNGSSNKQDTAKGRTNGSAKAEQNQKTEKSKSYEEESTTKVRQTDKVEKTCPNEVEPRVKFGQNEKVKLKNQRDRESPSKVKPTENADTCSPKKNDQPLKMNQKVDISSSKQVQQNETVENISTERETSMKKNQKEQEEMGLTRENKSTRRVNQNEKVEIYSSKETESTNKVNLIKAVDSSSHKELGTKVEHKDEVTEAITAQNESTPKKCRSEPDVTIKTFVESESVAEMPKTLPTKSSSEESIENDVNDVYLPRTNGKQKKKNKNSQKETGQIGTKKEETSAREEDEVKILAEARSVDNCMPTITSDVDTVVKNKDTKNNTRMNKTESATGNEESKQFERPKHIPDLTLEKIELKEVEQLEVKKKKIRRKKKNEMEESIYFEAAETPISSESDNVIVKVKEQITSKGAGSFVSSEANTPTDDEKCEFVEAFEDTYTEKTTAVEDTIAQESTTLNQALGTKDLSKNGINEEIMSIVKSKKKRNRKNNGMEESQIKMVEKDPVSEKSVNKSSSSDNAVTLTTAKAISSVDLVVDNTNDGSTTNQIVEENATAENRKKPVANISEESIDCLTNKDGLFPVKSKKKRKGKNNTNIEESEMVSMITNVSCSEDTTAKEMNVFDEEKLNEVPEFKGRYGAKKTGEKDITRDTDKAKESSAKGSDESQENANNEEEMFVVKSKKKKKNKNNPMEESQIVSLIENIHLSERSSSSEKLGGALGNEESSEILHENADDKAECAKVTVIKKPSCIEQYGAEGHFRNITDEDDFESEDRESHVEVDPADWETTRMDDSVSILVDEPEATSRILKDSKRMEEAIVDCKKNNARGIEKNMSASLYNSKPMKDAKVDSKNIRGGSVSVIIDDSYEEKMKDVAFDSKKDDMKAPIMEMSMYEGSSTSSSRSSEEREIKEEKNKGAQNVEGKSKKKKKKNRK